MQFQARYAAAIDRGAITVTFRRWKRCQVVVGHCYRTAAGRLHVDAVDVVEPASVTDDDARRAGAPSAAAVLADLRADGDLPIYRVRFHLEPGPDPRDELAGSTVLSDEERDELDRRLARLDRASSVGPWTEATLTVIEAQPGVRAADLASELGRERDEFKLDVRKLKGLGLTSSLTVGYRLSPRGEAYRSVRRDG
jgi:hypothetical protein